MGAEECLPVELLDIIQRVLLRRSQDIKHTVRIQSIHGLCRLQDPTNKDCPVVANLLWLARHDIPEVRRTALAALVLTTVTLPCVVERCRDVSDSVRKTAYNILAERSVLRPLSIAKRIAIIQDGLKDTSREVRKAAEELVLAWFKAVDQDPILLLRRLDTEGVPQTSRLCIERLLQNLDAETLKSVFKKWSEEYLDERHLPKPEKCSVECVFFWRVAAEYLLQRPTNKEDENGPSPDECSAILESIMPSVSDYAEYVISRVNGLLELLNADLDYNENIMEAECVLEHVFHFCDSLDLSDEFGRRRLYTVVRSWLVNPNVPASLTAFLLKLYFNIETSVNVRVQTVTEMISELLDSAEEASVVSANPLLTSNAVTATGPDAVAREATCLYAATPVIEPPNSAAQSNKGLTKAAERALRVKAAELRVKINELKDSLMQCISVQDFERASSLRDQCAAIEKEHSAILQELTGNVATASAAKAAIASSPPASKVPPPVAPSEMDEAPAAEKRADEADESDDETTAPEIKLVKSQTRYLSRLSADAILKANKMAAITVQQSPSLWTLPPSLRSLLYSLILPSVQHKDLAVRNQAILSLGLLCTMDLALSNQYISIFYEAVKFDHATIGVTAIKCLVDTFLIFGLQPFLDVAETLEETDFDITDLELIKGPQMNANCSGPTEKVGLSLRLLAPLLELMDSEDADLRTASALGLSKLFLFNRILSGQILSRILLLWFNSQTADLPTLSQSLGVFFTDYSCSKPERQACLADAVIPTLANLLAAPASSPLSEVDPGVVVSLLVRLTDSSCLLSNLNAITTTTAKADEDGTENRAPAKPSLPTENPCHDDLAMRLCNRVLNAPNSAEARLYIRVLGQLHLSLDKPGLYKDLLQLVEMIFKHIDRTSHLSLHRFKKNIFSCIEASGLNAKDFIVAAEEQNSETADNNVGSQTQAAEREEEEDVSRAPSLLGPPMPSSQLEDWDAVGRRSVTRNRVRNAMASLSFRGPSVNPRLLVFSDDEDEDNNEEKDEETVVGEEVDAEVVETPLSRESALPSTKSSSRRRNRNGKTVTATPSPDSGDRKASVNRRHTKMGAKTAPARPASPTGGMSPPPTTSLRHGRPSRKTPRSSNSSITTTPAPRSNVRTAPMRPKK
nr:unnamed protein product [Spirometra erinaceieuropaei]